MGQAELTSHADAVKTGTGYRWVIVAVLFLVQMTNWIDKTVVSLAATEIIHEFDLTTEEYGMIGGAFYSLYAVGGLLVAFFLAPRFPARKILMALLICWSIVQLPIVFAASFPILIAGRTLLGMGEGAATPMTLNSAHEWFPDKERSMPTAIIIFGATAGAMVAAPVLTAIIQAYEWRMAFLACAVFGAAVLLLWMLVSRDAPYAPHIRGAAKQQSQGAVSQAVASTPGMAGRLWRDPTLIGVTVVGMMAYWLTAFQVSWLAPYLQYIMKDPALAAWLLSLIFGFQAFCVLGLSYISQMLLRRGISSRIARGGLMGGVLAVAGLSLILVPLTSSVKVAVVLVAITISIYGVASPVYASIISEVTPPAERNRVMTVILSIMTLAAIPSSLVTGFVVASWGWPAAIASNGVAAIIGAAACFILINPARSIQRLSA